MTIPPDTKDWTWVLERRCPQCGLESASVALADVPDLLRDNAKAWADVLSRADAQARPEATVWSPLEYACHVRDVHRVFGPRYRQMLDADDPQFANWDQDVAALDGDYEHQQPSSVAGELSAAAQEAAELLAGVTPEQADRAGRRSNGSRFTVTSLARYHLHDVVHHLRDVRP
ncbi:DinB family protein [Angustibacter sp. Root456]|uniref:DinB family protein n=1 Tax=Angustibacter sp. Root456 TaxID=1736539 RepID=UPI0006FF1F9E|nr:DinB family protein [Angustibacter sp. Root456]KQX66657.1 methyltransferase type 12 [Angustibacter sp. Root456]